MREYTAVAASTRIPATTDSAGKHRTILMACHRHCRGEAWRDHNSTRRAAHRTCLTDRNTSATCSGGTKRSTREAGLCNPLPPRAQATTHRHAQVRQRECHTRAQAFHGSDALVFRRCRWVVRCRGDVAPFHVPFFFAVIPAHQSHGVSTCVPPSPRALSFWLSRACPRQAYSSSASLANVGVPWVMCDRRGSNVARGFATLSPQHSPHSDTHTCCESP